MALTCRRAEMADASLLWRWANDTETRRRSFNPAPIPYADHLAWLEARLAAEASALWIVSDEQGPVGQVRLDVTDGVAEVSLAVAPERRGQGLGTAMLREALATAATQWGGGLRLRAQVFADNVASLRLFQRCGFHEVATRRLTETSVVVLERCGS